LSSVHDEVSDEEILDRVAGRIVSMRMAVPAILFLESSKPLSFVGSQFLVFMEPFVKTFFTATLYDRFAELMEDRDQYELLIRKIERRESQKDDQAPDGERPGPQGRGDEETNG